MSSQPVNNARSTGLPAGVEAGPLGARFLAQLVDIAVPAIVALLASAITRATGSSGVDAVVSLAGALLVAVWALVVWWMFATRAAGPGMRLMKLQLVGLRDGRPIGYARYFLRALVLAALTITVVGLVLMVVFLIRQQRKQGWHDFAADSVVIKARALAPGRGTAQSAVNARSATNATDPDESTDGSIQAVAGQASSAPISPAPLSSAPQTGPASAPGVRSPAAAGFRAADLESPMGTADSVRMGPRNPVARPARAVVSAGGEDALPLDLGWFAVLDDGREIGVNGLVLLGRNPQARPGEEDAELIKVADATRTVSKTHLALSVDSDGLTVMDRGSTNGTTLTDETGVSQPSLAGNVVALHAGIIVSFGDHWLRIEHRR